ncbi:MAG: hypothetical protein H6704_08250 [Myxococcales bacterium]|nr:hypothetical protein [Myxococcales bacterium]
MRDDDRQRDDLRSDDRAFLDAVRDAYRPEPTNAAAFDRALRQRLAGGARRSIFAWGGGLALAATAAAALVIGLRATEAPPPSPARPDGGPAVSLSEVVAALDVEQALDVEADEALAAPDDEADDEAADDVFLALTVLEDAPEDEVGFADDTLPDDYLALGDLLDVTL